jgi:Fur family ferric uptake transcriptional regulator
VEDVLRGVDGFRTAQELFDELRRRGDRVGLSTVYRHLNLLAERGRADVVHRADGEAQYRLCGTADELADEHHHHVVCRACGRSVEVLGPEVEAWARRVAAASGYTETTHTVEVFGLCPEHSARPRRTRRGTRS